MIFIIFLLICTSRVIHGENYCDSSLCSAGVVHIGCNHTNSFDKSCPVDNAIISFTNSDVQQILDTHNSLRNKIGFGSEPGFKSAARMQKLSWNDELAYLASLNVKQCKMAHDKCRNTFQFKYSGQNLGYRANTSGFEGISNFLNNVIWAWYNEIKDATQSNIDFCCGGSNFDKIGHFLQIVQDSSRYVGCAASRYTNGQWKTILLACNYSYGNILNQAVYKSGNSASACQNGKNIKYPGLCN